MKKVFTDLEGILLINLVGKQIEKEKELNSNDYLIEGLEKLIEKIKNNKEN